MVGISNYCSFAAFKWVIFNTAYSIICLYASNLNAIHFRMFYFYINKLYCKKTNIKN